VRAAFKVACGDDGSGGLDKDETATSLDKEGFRELVTQLVTHWVGAQKGCADEFEVSGLSVFFFFFFFFFFVVVVFVPLRPSPSTRTLSSGVGCAYGSPGAGTPTSSPSTLSLYLQFSNAQVPSAKDLGVAFSLADSDRSGRVDEEEFVVLFRLIVRGEVGTNATITQNDLSSRPEREERERFLVPCLTPLSSFCMALLSRTRTGGRAGQAEPVLALIQRQDPAAAEALLRGLRRQQDPAAATVAAVAAAGGEGSSSSARAGFRAPGQQKQRKLQRARHGALMS